MKALLISFVVLLSSPCIGQAHISGANPAQPGATEYYTAYFDIGPNSYANIYWTVSGGTITSQSINPTSLLFCVVEWDTDPMTPGTIGIEEDMDGQSTSIEVMPGGSYEPVIAQYVQYVNYGSTPGIISITFSLQPPSVSYQWEIWNSATLAWSSLSGETSSTFQPPPVFSFVKYRCAVDVDGITYYPESAVWINSFSIGTVSISLTPPTLSVNYNSVPPITSSDATGGYCYPYQYVYTWEYSVENGPWVTIGTGSSFPVTAPPIIGKTAIRRRVSCGSLELVSNILTLYPNYTTGDYENRNYIREITVIKKGVVSWYQADALAIGDKFQSTTYLDGLERTIQKVDKGISSATNNTWKDLVTHYEYDAAGRLIKEFLPYATTDNVGKFKTNAATAQPSYILAFFGEPTSPPAPSYSLVEYDESPMNRIVKTMAPGKSWAGDGKGIKIEGEFNKENEKVHIWNLDYSSTAIPLTSPTLVYNTGTLIKNTASDEKGNKVINYTDLSGNLVLKKVQEANTPGNEHIGWICTYYVHDDLGRLRYIISPKAVAYLDNNGWIINQTIIDELCYKYLYDEKGRIYVKKQPGVLEEKMIYDQKDRLVLSQHANQDKNNNALLSKNQWSFTLYDDLNRTVATGLLDNDATQSTLKGYIEGGSLPASTTVSAFVGAGNVSIVTDYPVAGSTGANNSYLTGSSNIIFNSIIHYDNYTYTGVKAFNSTYILAYNLSDPNIEATIKTNRTLGMVTGEKTRVLDGTNNRFLFSTTYYDEEGRTIENLVDNINLNNGAGQDYEVNQYNFAGKMMSSYLSHKPNTSTTYTITSKNEFDKIGRLSKLYKNFNNSFYKQLAEYTFDELGQLKTKRLAPGYTGTGANEIELLTYEYNIQGALTGINKDYALGDNDYSQWDRYFGMYIGYDNRLPHGPGNASFANWQLNGNITGLIWKSQGDNTPRKFDFEYDNLDRFTKANFKQRKKPSESIWANTEVDFSTTVEYGDANGNLKSMKHMGVVPGANSQAIDDLQYSYLETGVTGINGPLTGNQLQRVEDQSPMATNNQGLLGDFKNVNVNTQDYWYDKNGNLIKDLNKNIKNGLNNGIIYNYINKPEKIILEGRSTIEFTYDASGEKLKKRVSYANGDVRTTYYTGDYVYEDFAPASGGGQGPLLQYVLYEEGRLKIITPHTTPIPVVGNDYQLNAGAFGILNWPGNKQGVFEYFIKDHLGSTRMVLTEEFQKEFYIASMEAQPATLKKAEEKLFGQVDPSTGDPSNANELNKTRLSNQSVWPGNSSDIVQLTATASDKIMGPNMILKVMAGDLIHGDVKYYYANNASGSPNYSNLLSSMVGSFINALGGNKASSLGKYQSADINTSLNTNPDPGAFVTSHNENVSQPKAYLNIVFFDEQFKFIARDLTVQATTGTNFVRISATHNSTLTLTQKAPKNGWVFIFLSNESNEPVYFDDFAVTQEHSRIVEENHYYPYGLKIGGISSRAGNKLSNKYNYQGDFAEDEEETGWDEFDLRMYDPQIGRWTGVDPYEEFLSPYVGMGNNPLNQIDQDGGRTSFFGEDPFPGKPRSIKYKIKGNNTIEKIAKNFSLNVSDILDANPQLKNNPKKIKIGEKITIPIYPGQIILNQYRNAPVYKVPMTDEERQTVRVMNEIAEYSNPNLAANRKIFFEAYPHLLPPRGGRVIIPGYNQRTTAQDFSYNMGIFRNGILKVHRDFYVLALASYTGGIVTPGVGATYTEKSIEIYVTTNMALNELRRKIITMALDILGSKLGRQMVYTRWFWAAIGGLDKEILHDPQKVAIILKNAEKIINQIKKAF